MRTPEQYRTTRAASDRGLVDTSRPRTRRLVGVAIAIAMGTVAQASVTNAAAASKLLVSAPTAVFGQFEDLSVDPDGSVRVATSGGGSDDRSRGWVTRVVPGGPASRRSAVFPPTAVLRSGVPTVLTPTGAVTAYRAHGGGRTVIKTVTTPSGRAPSAPRAASTAGQLANEPELVAGGGAVAVLYTARRPGHGAPQQTVAVRPRGARRFGRPVGIDPPTRQFPYRYVAAIGPTGEGAIVATPVFEDTPIRLRRIARDGAVGPWIILAPGPYEDSTAALAVAKDGTIAVALVATPSGQSTTEHDAEAYLVTTSLAPGASSATPVQVLESVGDGITADDNLDVSIGDDGRTLVTGGPGPIGDEGPGRIDLFAGPSNALARRASFVVNGPVGALGVVRHDGGMTAVWQARRSDDSSFLVGTTAGADGRFARPRTIARTALKAIRDDLAGEVGPVALAPLRGSRTVLVYSDESSDRGHLNVVSLRGTPGS